MSVPWRDSSYYVMQHLAGLAATFISPVALAVLCKKIYIAAKRQHDPLIPLSTLPGDSKHRRTSSWAAVACSETSLPAPSKIVGESSTDPILEYVRPHCRHHHHIAYLTSMGKKGASSQRTRHCCRERQRHLARCPVERRARQTAHKHHAEHLRSKQSRERSCSIDSGHSPEGKFHTDPAMDFLEFAQSSSKDGQHMYPAEKSLGASRSFLGQAAPRSSSPGRYGSTVDPVGHRQTNSAPHRRSESAMSISSLCPIKLVMGNFRRSRPNSPLNRSPLGKKCTCQSQPVLRHPHLQKSVRGHSFDTDPSESSVGTDDDTCPTCSKLHVAEDRADTDTLSSEKIQNKDRDLSGSVHCQTRSLLIKGGTPAITDTTSTAETDGCKSTDCMAALSAQITGSMDKESSDICLEASDEYAPKPWQWAAPGQQGEEKERDEALAGSLQTQSAPERTHVSRQDDKYACLSQSECATDVQFPPVACKEKRNSKQLLQTVSSSEQVKDEHQERETPLPIHQSQSHASIYDSRSSEEHLTLTVSRSRSLNLQTKPSEFDGPHANAVIERDATLQALLPYRETRDVDLPDAIPASAGQCQLNPATPSDRPEERNRSEDSKTFTEFSNVDLADLSLTKLCRKLEDWKAELQVMHAAVDAAVAALCYKECDMNQDGKLKDGLSSQQQAAGFSVPQCHDTFIASRSRSDSGRAQSCKLTELGNSISGGNQCRSREWSNQSIQQSSPHPNSPALDWENLNPSEQSLLDNLHLLLERLQRLHKSPPPSNIVESAGNNRMSDTERQDQSTGPSMDKQAPHNDGTEEPPEEISQNVSVSESREKQSTLSMVSPSPTISLAGEMVDFIEGATTGDEVEDSRCTHKATSHTSQPTSPFSTPLSDGFCPENKRPSEFRLPSIVPGELADFPHQLSADELLLESSRRRHVSSYALRYVEHVLSRMDSSLHMSHQSGLPQNSSDRSVSGSLLSPTCRSWSPPILAESEGEGWRRDIHEAGCDKGSMQYEPRHPLVATVETIVNKLATLRQVDWKEKMHHRPTEFRNELSANLVPGKVNRPQNCTGSFDCRFRSSKTVDCPDHVPASHLSSKPVNWWENSQEALQINSFAVSQRVAADSLQTAEDQFHFDTAGNTDLPASLKDISTDTSSQRKQLLQQLRTQTNLQSDPASVIPSGSQGSDGWSNSHSFSLSSSSGCDTLLNRTSSTTSVSSSDLVTSCVQRGSSPCTSVEQVVQKLDHTVDNLLSIMNNQLKV